MSTWRSASPRLKLIKCSWLWWTLTELKKLVGSLFWKEDLGQGVELYILTVNEFNLVWGGGGSCFSPKKKKSVNENIKKWFKGLEKMGVILVDLTLGIPKHKFCRWGCWFSSWRVFNTGYLSKERWKDEAAKHKAFFTYLLETQGGFYIENLHLLKVITYPRACEPGLPAPWWQPVWANCRLSSSPALFDWTSAAFSTPGLIWSYPNAVILMQQLRVVFR